MEKLTKLGDKTYVIESPVNVGIYLINDNDVCLIDTGSSKDFAKIISKVIEENNWHLKCIINTHSHADHIGGNNYLQNKYNCEIYASSVESYFVNYPLLEPALLYGASPIKDLCHSFLLAKPSICKDIKDLNLEGIEIIDLKGHSAGLIGILTSDGVLFAGDAYTSPRILDKYAIQFTYDIKDFLETLNFLKKTNYNYYVPSHGEVEKDPTKTLDANEKNIVNIENELLKVIGDGSAYNEIITKIFSFYHIKESVEQYYIIGVTIKALLTKLLEENKINFSIKDGNIFISKVI